MTRHLTLTAALCLAAALAACGSDEGNSGTTPPADAGTVADGASSDGSVSADSGQTSSDASAEDSSSAGTDSASDPDTGASSDAVSPSDSGSTDAGGTADTAAGSSMSCQGTLSCAIYAQMKDFKQCEDDPGCTGGAPKCQPVDPNMMIACAKAGGQAQCKSMPFCKWAGNTCAFVDTCSQHKSKSQCAKPGPVPCGWLPSTCTGFATKLSCAKAPGEQACKTTPGCAWTDCKPTNGGVEVCDGVDNDCDGVTDNPQTPKGAICDDGDQCNGAETCNAGQCQAGKAIACKGKACHDATCDKTKGCVYTPNTKPCDDKNPCTEGDVCAAGKCAPGKPKSCDDGDACTKDTCKVAQPLGGGVPKAVCENKADGAAACDDKNPCTDDSCDPKTGCKHANNTKPCDDGNACTGGAGGLSGGKSSGTGDVCAAGKCTPGAPKKCDDANACTDDSCDPKSGCVHLANAASCDDGSPCTTGEKCAAKACKGGTNKCDDGNICTTDSCDSKGTCKNTPIVGCKTCKAATECNDSNGCTKDACTAGKCTYTKISGCIGPTDYEVVSLDPVKDPTPVPGGFQFKLTVKNEGKPYGGSFSGKMTWTIYLSEDDKIDSGDKKLYGTKWDGYNIGAPKKISSYVLKGVSIQDPTWVKGKKYTCVRLAGGGDKNLANNDKCFQIKYLLPNFKLLDFQVLGGTVTAGQKMPVKYSYKNEGGDVPYVYVDFYHSTDAVFDDKDLKVQGYGFKKPIIKQGATYTVKYETISTQPVAQASHKYFCMVVNVWQGAWKKESNTKDNAICKPMTVVNKPNVSFAQNHIGFRDKKGKVWGNVPYGAEYGCYLTQISNTANGDLDGSFPIRCWLADSTTWNYGMSQIGWQVMWNWTGKIEGKGSKKLVYSPTFTKLEPKTVGVKWLCGDLNHDKKLPETDFNNKVCRKITVLGMDLTVDNAKSKVGAASWKNPQPGTLKRGTPLNLEMVWCNAGNQAIEAKAKGLRTRILLSKDDKASADDHVIHLNDKFLFNKVNGMNQFGKPSCVQGIVGGTKHTIPTSIPAGQYHLIFDINSDGKHLEPSGNNAVVKKITLQ